MNPIHSNDVEIGGLRDAESGPASGAVSGKPGASFADTLTHALGEVDRAQTDADVQATKVAEGSGNLHEMSLSLEKADIAMRVATKVRNKLVDTYQDIMRMSL